MTCVERIGELVECARRHGEPGRELGAHLAACAGCAERFEAERELSGQLRAIRARGVALMAQDTQREVLMRDFAELHRRRPAQRWLLAFSAAAALFAAILVGNVAGRHAARPTPVPAIRSHEAHATQVVAYEESTDAGSLSSDDFTAVPYTPPLAQGELVRVVHADLYPEALASMGIDVDPAWGNEIPAEVVVGEDGIPRAVRIADTHTDDF